MLSISLPPPDQAYTETDIDVSWLLRETEANRYFRNKGLSMRFIFWWKTPDVLEIKIRQYVVAVYVKSINKLYRVDGSLDLHWRMVKRAIEQSAPAA